MSLIVAYSLLGKCKLETYSDLDNAEEAGHGAVALKKGGGFSLQFSCPIVIVTKACLREFRAVNLLAFIIDLWRSMTPAKWLQLVTYLLAWCGYGNFLADRKWADEKRTLVERRNFRLLRTVYGLVLIGLGIGLAVFFNEKDKAPFFNFYVNDLLLKQDSYLIVPTTNSNSSVSLTFQVANDGSAVSDGLNVTVGFPSALQITSSFGWNQVRGYNSNDVATLEPAFGIESRDMVSIRASDIFPPLVVQGYREDARYGVLLTADSLNAKGMQKRHFWVRFVNGSGQPYILSEQQQAAHKVP